MTLHSKFIFILTNAQFIFEQINFVNSITWHYENKFTLISKHIKKQRNFESGLPERRWRPNFIKNVILVPKTLRMKILELRSFKKKKT